MIKTFLLENSNSVGRRVDNAILSIGAYIFMAESFLPDDEVIINLSFKLPDKIRVEGAPVFNADFGAKVISIPGTSFISWLSKETTNEDIVSIIAESVTWLPNLGNVSSGFKEKNLGLLASELKNEIKKFSPQAQKVSFLGTSIPGILFVYTAPILLISFFYYLRNHVRHLFSLSNDRNNQKKISQFPWIPLTQVSYWRIDFYATSCFLPIASMFVLYFQINQFGNVGMLSIFLIIVCIVTSIFVTRNIHVYLDGIRENIYERKQSLIR